MSNEYNGWTNYETWLANVWLSNEQGTDEMIREWAREEAQSAIDKDEDKGAAVYAMSKRIESLLDDMQEEAGMPTSGLLADLLGAAIRSIDFYELAEHYYLSDITFYAAGWNMPGYMPDSTPAVFLDCDDAREYIASEIESEAEKDEDINAQESAEAAAEAIRQGKGELSVTVGAYHYFITVQE